MGRVSEPKELELVDMIPVLFAAMVVRGWRESFDFYSRKADVAAVAVYSYLGSQPGIELMFHMRLHPIHGDCGTWRHGFRPHLGATFRRWTPGGPCEITMSASWLDLLLSEERIPGDRAMWLECADVFRRAYEAA